MGFLVAGRMDRRITLQSFTETPNAIGEPVKTWANLASVPDMWAEVTPLRGAELFASQQIAGEADTRFRVRYRDDLGAEMRVVYEGANYDIQSILEIGREEGLEILAKKEQA